MSSLFSSKQKSSSSSTSTPIIENWVKSGLVDATELASNYASQPFSAYTDQRFADFSEDELAAFDLARSLTGQYSDSTNYANSVLSEVTRQGLEGIDQSLIDAYANPYTTMVMDTQKTRALEQFDTAKQNLKSQQAQIGAFGGSRAALAEQALYDDFSTQLAETEAQMLSDRYESALSGAQQSLQTAQTGATDLANLASLTQTLGLQDVSSLSSIGSQQRALEQAGLDFDYEEFLREEADALTKAQGLMGIAGTAAQLTSGQQNNATATQTSTPSVASMLGQTIGMATGLGGMGSSLLGGLSGLGSSAMSLGTSLGSDSLFAIGNYLGSGGAYTRSLPQVVSAASNGAYGPAFAKGGLVEGYQKGGLIDVLGDSAKFFDKRMAQAQDIFSPLPQQPNETRFGRVLRNARNILGEGLSLPFDIYEAGKGLGSAAVEAGLEPVRDYEYRKNQEAISRVIEEQKGLPSLEDTYVVPIEDSLMEEFLTYDTPDSTINDSELVDSKVQGISDATSSEYDVLLNQLREELTKADSNRKGSTVFEDPLFNWGLALVQGRDPVSAYSGMKGEERETDFETINKEKAIRDLAANKLRTEAYQKQVNLQEQGAPTDEERQLKMDKIRSEIANSVRKSLGQPTSADVIKGWQKLVSQTDTGTLNNPTLWREAQESYLKNLSSQFGMSTRDIADIISSISQ